MDLICCTIVTPSHINKAIVLLESLKRYNSRFNFFILVTEPIEYSPVGVNVISLQKLISEDESAGLVAEKYFFNTDSLRWSLKPVFMRYLLKRYTKASLIYCDCDMYFLANPKVLLNGLRRGGIVLTPHWRPMEPEPSLHSFRLNFQDGLFNAGCITANKKGLPALDWWARACLSGCEMDRESGLYHDQRYLDLMLVYFPQAIICRDKGYNVADWNHQIRTEMARKEKHLNITLIHFSENTVKKILAGKDPLLESYYAIYKEHLATCMDNLKIENVSNHNLPHQLEKA